MHPSLPKPTRTLTMMGIATDAIGLAGSSLLASYWANKKHGEYQACSDQDKESMIIEAKLQRDRWIREPTATAIDKAELKMITDELSTNVGAAIAIPLKALLGST